MRIRVAASIGLLSAALSGCASVNEVRLLEREVLELKRLRNAPTDQQQRVADLGVAVRELREELARMQGSMEQLEFALEEIRRELAARGIMTPGTDLPGTGGDPALGGPAPFVQGPGGAEGPAGGAPALGPATTPSGQEPGGAVPGGLGQPSGLGAEVAAYEEAFRRYRSQQYEEAIQGFREFLKKYPSSGYADNALFWLGDCYFKEGDFASAAVAFEDVVKKYPDGNKVPDALYRQGLSLIEIGAKTDQPEAYRGAAREIFKKILDTYPSSERAPEARRQLEKLGT